MCFRVFDDAKSVAVRRIVRPGIRELDMDVLYALSLTLQYAVYSC